MKAGQRVRIGEREMACAEGRTRFTPHARWALYCPPMFALSPTLAQAFRIGWNAARMDWIHRGRPVQQELPL